MGLFGTPLDPVAFKLKAYEKLGYEPHPGQLRIHKSSARWRCWAAAARVGKTYAAAYEVVARALDPRGQLIWIVAPNYILTEKIFRLVWKVLCDPRRNFPVTRKSWRSKEIFLGTGTEIYGKSCVREESLLGEGVDFMVVDEASRIKQAIYEEYLFTRLSTGNEGMGGDFLAISTPKGKGTFFHKLYLRGKDKHNPLYVKYDALHSTLDDNPLISDEVRRDLVIMYGGVDSPAYRQEVLGEFISMEGEVFPSYDEDVFFRKVDYIEGVDVDATIDIGTRNPFACLLIQKNGRQIRFFEEHYRSGFSSLQNALWMLPVFKKYKIRRCVIDRAALDARKIFEQIIPFCTFVPGESDILLGLEVLRDHHQIDPITNEPLVVYDNSMTNTKFEFERARYPKGEHEKPVDADNHSIAAQRYYMLKYCNFLEHIDPLSIDSFGQSSILDTAFRNDINPMRRHLQTTHDCEFESSLWMGDFNNDYERY